MPRPSPSRAPRTVFYAWQSDLPQATNRYFIRDALQRAIKRLGAAGGTAPPLAYDETTLGVPGSPVIADTILAKIDACEVFVGDISIINVDAPAGRRVPNPNVVFEAAWAAARIGWDRVVLVFNTATGVVETDVLFDLRGHRLLRYGLTADAGDRKVVSGRLTDDLAMAVTSALDSPAPVRRTPRAKVAGAPSAEQQHARDAETLYRLLGVLDTQWVDAFLEALRDGRILDNAEVQSVRFTGVVGEARFHLFDRRTEKAIREFAAAWHRVQEVTLYGDSVSGTRYAKFRPDIYDLSDTGRTVSQTRREFQEARDAMDDRFRTMTKRIHSAFPELDMVESDARARRSYEAL